MGNFTSYSLAGDDPNPMTAAEVTALKYLVRGLPENPLIIQIGAERGCSTLAILEERPDCFIFSIDIGEARSETEHLIQAGLDPHRVVRGLGMSQNIGKFWPKDWWCHMLFVDGDHKRPGIDLDIELWADKVKPPGIVAFHDYIPDPQPPIQGRVAESVDEWVARYQKTYFTPPIEILRENRLIAYRA